MYRSVQRVRYPPFDHENSDPVEIPLVEVLLESENPPPPNLRIGNDSSWIIEWREETEGDSSLPKINTEVTTETLPFLMRTRNGWYIDPDPLHSTARKMIFPGVLVLVVALMLHALEPALISIAIIPDFIFTPISIGPLDYPLMILIAFPIFIIPILLRVVANIMDIRRQNEYIADPLSSPEVEISNISVDGAEISKISFPEGITATRARVQVGVAVPKRDVLLEAIGRSKDGQPAPGMSTGLPERRISTADEHGTGVGESVPMPVSRGRLLLLEPMRVQDFGPWTDVVEESFILLGPSNQWPGNIYSAMIAIHWEIVIEASKSDGTRMKWVRPINIEAPNNVVSIDKLPVRSGRVES
ncbi:MAG TPA: hypothetical protein HA314_01290 [Candidatus Thalassarchaeaceae archaeon]|nr:MAG TPA: hypothetical protein D7H71_01295 [Candidatus Poseidoniales archaeon]HII28649.1 hypothetical protein [Candidatus Thalassarchaeaceae archaeon]|tara:strand:- start:2371 stop:3444 length:1074 start_codon:yes stop_codon:yes gene_type:complete